ncbi:MAG: hypothetical protein ACI9UO_000518 [Nitrospinales bacterium]|jgi:hypothetical protein
MENIKLLGPVEHIVVLMFENRSFDNFLGRLKTYVQGLRVCLPAGPIQIPPCQKIFLSFKQGLEQASCPTLTLWKTTMI